jgi:ubiquinone/menaquinone biosynthesis C-methylase UbiE
MDSSDVAKNRTFWNRESDEYQRRNAEFITHDEIRWGLWQLPDAELGVRGDVSGRDVLELGSGGGQFGMTLARSGARVTGLDVSEKQLEHARANGVDFPLVLGSADDVPLPDASFDLVVADHGANRFVDPHRFVPEAARLLRPGGLFVFSGSTPFELVCLDVETDKMTTGLQRDYFGMHRVEFPEGVVEFELAYGEWIRVFRTSGFVVEDLVEVQPPPGVESTYRDADETAWARRWPMEQIWKVRKV